VLPTLLLGFALGFLGSVPTAGPVGMLVVSRVLMGRPRTALHIAAGSTLAETVYAFAAFWGFAAILARFPHLVATSRVVACVLLVGVGLYFIVRGPSQGAAAESHDRGGPRSGLLGLSMTALNPTVLLTWGAAVGIAHGAGIAVASPWAAIPFALGAGAGILSWFAILVWLVARVHLRPSTLNVIVRGLGGVLVVSAVAMGVRLIV
jgi:threonine/homoserine/homoserine lactone efflux protein